MGGEQDEKGELDSLLLHPRDNLAWTYFQGARDGEDSQKGRLTLAALEPSDRRAIEARLEREIFLRDSRLLSDLSQHDSESTNVVHLIIVGR
jgi:hypothetical protein